MAPTTDHLVGLLLGAEEDWPTAFESFARRSACSVRRTERGTR